MRPRANDVALVRAVGFWTLAASIVNVTIGGSIFALPGALAASMGSAAALAFVLGALLFVPIAICFAAAGSRITATGGPYRYVDAAYGRYPGFLVAFLFWISNVAGSGGLAAAFADQLTHLFPQIAQPLPRDLVMFAVYAVLTALNARGVKVGSAAIVIFALAKILPLVALVAAGIHYVNPGNLRISAVPTFTAVGSSLVAVVFAYSGLETALSPSGEVKNAAVVVPKATLVGVMVVVGLYISVQVVAQGVLGAHLRGNAAPLLTVADKLFFDVGGLLVVVTASVSLLGCLHGDILGSSRLLYALAHDRLLPAWLAQVSIGQRVPMLAVVTHALSAWVLAVAGSFTTLALLSGGVFCLVYIATCASAWKLQRLKIGDTGKPFLIPGGAALPLVAIVGLIAILATLNRAEWLAIVSAILFATVLYFLRMQVK